ncbi:hypothetical protein [Fibrella aestuarina]|nr:hypothetical protein [Fibrella aestuarina]
MNHTDNDEIRWSDPAWLTYQRMPPDVQVGIDQTIESMFDRYAPVYRQRPVDIVSVGTVSHMHVPDWGMWLRFETEYYEDKDKAYLCIESVDELTLKEFEESVAATRAKSDRIS